MRETLKNVSISAIMCAEKSRDKKNLTLVIILKLIFHETRSGKVIKLTMYSGVKSRVKYCKQLGDSFTCMLGVQVECLPQFLFAMFLNDVENVFLEQGMNGI